MHLPCSTGEAARLLGTTEPRLAETVRRGKVRPEPRIVAGRRLWDEEHILQAAVSLGVPEPPGLRTEDGETIPHDVPASSGTESPTSRPPVAEGLEPEGQRDDAPAPAARLLAQHGRYRRPERALEKKEVRNESAR